MSLFACLVLLPSNTAMENIEAEVEKRLAPYDEQLMLESHPVACWCVGMKAGKEVAAEAERQFPVAEYQEMIAKLPQEQQTEEKWKEIVQPRLELEKRLLELHPDRDAANPDCPSCQGTGTYMTEGNPNAKWDWWVIGGSYDGWIFGPEREEACRVARKNGETDRMACSLANNVRPVRDLPIDDEFYCPFAVVTPEGQWYAEGEMRWFAVVNDAVDYNEWHRQVKALLAQYSDHLAVAVECHI